MLADVQPIQPIPVLPQQQKDLLKRAESTSLDAIRQMLPQRSLGIFDMNGTTRTTCLKLVFHPFFDWFVLMVILLSVAPLFFLSHEQAIEHESSLLWMDVLFTIFFTIEIIIRAIAVGLYASPKSLLRDAFSCMDFIIVLLSIISFSPWFSSRPTIFRLLRVFRPLRSLNAVPALKKVTRSLARTFPAIWPVLIFLFFFVFVSAVFGVQLLRGALHYRCVPINLSNDDVMDLDDWEDDFFICSASGLGQACDVPGHECRDGFPNPEENWLSFDNVFIAILNIFWGLTLEGWAHQTSFAYEAMGSVGYWYVFLVCIGGAFYVLNLFTAIIATKYGEVEAKEEYILVKDEFTGDYNLVVATEHSKNLYNVSQEVQTEEVDGDEVNSIFKKEQVHFIKKFCSKIVMTFTFELLSTVFVLSNMIVLSIIHYGMSDSLESKLSTANQVITLLFLIEVLFRICATGSIVKHFKKSFFDGFDIVIVTFGVIELLVYLPQFQGFSVLRVFRLARVLRIFSLSRSWKSFHRLLNTIAASMKQLLPFITIVTILLFIFSAIGVEVFDPEKIATLDDPSSFYFANFIRSLENTWLTSTGEDWNDLAADTLDYAKDPFIAGVFFIAIIVVFTFLLMNLLIGIIVDNFVNAREAEKIKNQSIQFDCELIDTDVNVIDTKKARKSKKVKRSPQERAQYSFNYFHLDNPIRRICLKLNSSTVFTTFIYFLVFVSCVVMALQQPDVSPDHWTRRHSEFILNILALVFLGELVINSIALSLFGVNGVFRTPFIAFDSVIIIITAIEVFVPSGSPLALLRSLRALRPLRLLSLSKSGKLVTQALALASPAIFNATLLFLVFLTVFGIVGVQMFGGLASFQGDYDFGVLLGFDNVPQAVYSLFSYTTQEYLPAAFRYYVTDISSMIYFVSYMVFGFWIITNVFISLLTEEFSDSAAKIRAKAGETDEVRRARMVLSSVTKSICAPIRPCSDSFVLRKVCFKIGHWKYFDSFVTVLILVNALLLASYHAGMSDDLVVLFRQIGDVFTIIFAIEITVKIIGFGKMFLADYWNIFDLFVVLATSGAFFVGSSYGSFIVLFRLLRVLRIVRLSRRLTSIRKIIRTTTIALPALAGVSVVAMVIFFVFAVYGMRFFADVPTGIVNDGLYEPIVHFRNFFSAMFTLVMATSGEEWQGLMVNAAACPIDTPDCNGTLTSTLFFIPMIYLCRFIILNLISAAIVDAFVTASKDFLAVITPSDISDFISIWGSLDPDGVGFINVTKLEELFCSLKPPLSPGANVEVVNTVLRSLDVPLYNKKGDESNHLEPMYICVYDLLPSIIIRLLGPTTLNIPKNVERTIKLSQKKRVKAMIRFNFTQNELSLREMYAARFIVDKYRLHVEKLKQNAEFKETAQSEEVYISELLNL
ncbi:hypothetical protein P9112_002261 [Eukaryota sp. TZLM1-RC]